jgi:hypothetical protein
MKLSALILLLLAALQAQPANFGRYGLALRIGRASGGMGLQGSYNLSRNWQIGAGAGGVGWWQEWPLATEGKEFKDVFVRSDGYFLEGRRYFLKHGYLASTYLWESSTLQAVKAEGEFQDRILEQAIFLDLGYEFGNRDGFYFSGSASYCYQFGKQVRTLRTGPPGQTVSIGTEGGSSFGLQLALGYYFGN